MLKLVKEDELQLRLQTLKSITVCFNKWLKSVHVQVIEMNNGDACVFRVNPHIIVESFSAMYINDNNVKVNAQIGENDELERIVICSSKFTKRRLIEIIELTDGRVMIVPLSKNIITEKVDSEYLESECNKME